MMEFLDEVHDFQRSSPAPILVHCSAGVGRSGVFTCLYSLREALSCETEVCFLNVVPGPGSRISNIVPPPLQDFDKLMDVRTRVFQMREARNPIVVQTQDQYVFIFEALRDILLEMLGGC